MIKFLQKHFQGGHLLRFFFWYISLPKLAPVFAIGMIAGSFGEMYEVYWIMWTGRSIIAFAIFCFFLPAKE